MVKVSYLMPFNIQTSSIYRHMEYIKHDRYTMKKKHLEVNPMGSLMFNQSTTDISS